MLRPVSMRVRGGLAFATVTFTGLAACTPTASQSSPATPGASLDAAISAVLNAPNFTLVIKESGTQGSAAFSTVVTTVTTWVIEKPDKISLTGTSGTGDIIAIGDNRYSEDQGVWSELNHEGVAANYTNGALQFVHLLLRANGVVRQGTTYLVPSADAKSLLVATGMSQYQGVSTVSFSATVLRGLLDAIRLNVTGTFHHSTTVTISRVGTSPPITAPSVGGSG